MHKHHHRLPALDVIRGQAVILMIIFHLSYDLNLFGMVGPIDFLNDPFWYWFPRLIVFLFLFCAGAGLALAWRNRQLEQNFWPRLGKITLLAITVSAVTWWMFPQHWIFFGILHCIALSTLLARPLVARPRLALALGSGILAANLILRAMWGRYTLVPLSDWLGVQPMDYEPLFPWFGVVLIGIWVGHQRRLENLRWGDSSWGRGLVFLGRKSLLIYLLHQPLFYGALSLWQWTRG